MHQPYFGYYLCIINLNDHVNGLIIKVSLRRSKISRTIKYSDLNGTPTVLYSVAKQTCTAINSDFELEVTDDTNLFLVLEGININGKHVAILGDVSKIVPLSKARVKDITIVGKEIQVGFQIGNPYP